MVATDTDIRLRSFLDTNQLGREQMCRSILALDSHYSDVRPRHPSGGPDGGRDIEALFDNTHTAFGAVGFANSANDSDTQKKTLRKKFDSDVKSAVNANPELKIFVFLTNVHFTMGEQDEMKKAAKKHGIEHCDVLDRERLRIELDSPSGFFIRFQYLSIPLSEAEQASFLSKYGSQIQDVVTTGFQKVEKTLNRLLFLTESRDSLGQLTFRFVLKKSYLASEIAHFRSFIFLTLREGRPDMLIIWFGSSDGANRFRDDVSDAEKEATSGISSGICTSQWEKYTPPPSEHESSKTNLTGFDKNPLEYKQTSCWSGDGHDTVSDLFARYLHGGTRRIKFPRLSLRDLNDGIFLPFVNASLAEKIHSIQIFANGYKLEDLGPNEFKIDRSSFGVTLPGGFTDEELNDPWVRLRPTTFNSAYHFRFGGTTPRRIYDHEEPSDSPLPPELDKR